MDSKPLTVWTPKTNDELKLVRLVDPPEDKGGRPKKNAHGDYAIYLPHSMGKTYATPLHSSSVKNYWKCPRYFMLKDRLGLERRGSYAPALFMGTVFHKVVELAYRGLNLQGIRSELTEWFQGWSTNHIAQTTNSLGLMPDGTPHTSWQSRVTEDFQKAMACAECWLHYYPVDTSDYEVIAVEEKIYAELISPRISLQGTLDLVLRCRKTGHLVIVDHKTTSKKPVDIADGLLFDGQPQIYRLLAMARWPSSSVAKVVHNIIKKPTIKFCGKDALTEEQKETDPSRTEFDNYVDRVKLWYKSAFDDAENSVDPKKHGNWPLIQSGVLFTKSQPIPDFVALIHQVSKVTKRKVNAAEFPRICNNYLCTDWGGGGKPCEFLPICRQEQVDPRAIHMTDIIDRLYVQSHRDEQETD